MCVAAKAFKEKPKTQRSKVRRRAEATMKEVARSVKRNGKQRSEARQGANVACIRAEVARDAATGAFKRETENQRSETR